MGVFEQARAPSGQGSRCRGRARSLLAFPFGTEAGRRARPLSTRSLDTLALAHSHSPSLLLAAPSHPPTTPAALEHFTVNFTITNLPDNSDLATPHSAKFNATRRVMNTLVRAPLLQQSLCPR